MFQSLAVMALAFTFISAPASASSIYRELTCFEATQNPTHAPYLVIDRIANEPDATFRMVTVADGEMNLTVDREVSMKISDTGSIVPTYLSYWNKSVSFDYSQPYFYLSLEMATAVKTESELDSVQVAGEAYLRGTYTIPGPAKKVALRCELKL